MDQRDWPAFSTVKTLHSEEDRGSFATRHVKMSVLYKPSVSDRDREPHTATGAEDAVSAVEAFREL